MTLQRSDNGSPDITPLPLTGERTIPDLDSENYWFRRHEVVYEAITQLCSLHDIVDAGSGEGYGAHMLSRTARTVTALDYNHEACVHMLEKYPQLGVIETNLVSLPLKDEATEIIVNSQVIEHLWDQEAFLEECARILQPGGLLIVSTPNRITFTPEGAPLNPFHTRELSGNEMSDLLISSGFDVAHMVGVFHGTRLSALDAKWGGSIIDAQLQPFLENKPWPEELQRDVAGIQAGDFILCRCFIPEHEMPPRTSFAQANHKENGSDNNKTNTLYPGADTENDSLFDHGMRHTEIHTHDSATDGFRGLEELFEVERHVSPRSIDESLDLVAFAIKS